MTPTVVAPLPGAASEDVAADELPEASSDTAGLQAASTATTAAAISAPAVRRIRMEVPSGRPQGRGGRGGWAGGDGQAVRLLSNTLESSSGAASIVRLPSTPRTTRVRTNGMAASANWFTAYPAVCSTEASDSAMPKR